jgi:hypothetical protein
LKYTQNIYDIQNDKVDISKSMADKITVAFPDIDKNWLLTGEGNMLKENIRPGDIVMGTETSEPAPIPQSIWELLKQQTDIIKSQLEQQNELVKSQQLLIHSQQTVIENLSLYTVGKQDTAGDAKIARARS